MAKDVSLRTLKIYWPVYLFILPSLLLVAVFSYFPAVSAFYHAFFRWNGEDINYYVGDLNFRRALGAYWLWGAVFLTFMLTMVFAGKPGRRSTIFKIFSGIVVAATALITLLAQGLALSTASEMIDRRTIIVSLVLWGGGMLLTKIFASSENDRRWITMLIFAILLGAGVLRGCGLNAVFAWFVIMLTTGIILWTVKKMRQMPYADTVQAFQAFATLGIAFWALAEYGGGDPILWNGFFVILILVAFNIVKMIPSIITAVVINRLTSGKMSYLYKVCFVIPMIIPGMVMLLLWKFFFDANVGFFNHFLTKTGLMNVLIHLDGWLGWGGVFKEGITPVWLGNESLVLPAIILWGFPWVGVVGVLIYLAGLENISESVYEAAGLDGAGPIQKFLHIELPLILTQVRINMVLMIIATLQTYAFILILFGTGGGPNGKLLVPGLFMFTNAFQYGNAGYACAIGLIIFSFILLLTELNNRYIRIKK
jgi:ABC-type sugar transport system permease subunit